MTILALDTSNKTLSVAVELTDGTIIEQTIENTLQHSVLLMPTIEAVFKEAGITAKDLTKVVVAEGPGSYTGLRIGVTVAKTLAKSLGIPLVGVSSLDVFLPNLASKVEVGEVVVPFFDARRGNIFAVGYKKTDEGFEKVIGEQHISWDDFLKVLPEHAAGVTFVGQLQSITKEAIVEKGASEAKWLEGPDAIPHATSLIELGRNKEAVDADVFVPMYLKLAEAEENWQAEHPLEKGSVYVERV